MALPTFSMRELLEAGAHFGHQTHRWNPKMEPFIFGQRNGIHIVDLSQTVPLLHQALSRSAKRSRAAGACCSSAPSARPPISWRMPPAFGAVLHQSPLVWRHADQLADDHQLDQAPALSRRAARRRSPRLHQARAPRPHARARQAAPGYRRHQGHGRHPRPAVRHRHQQGIDRRRRGAQASYSCHRDPRQ